MSPKELKKLADACRKAGISSFKNADVEFTLSDYVPSTPKRIRTKKGFEQPSVVEQDEIEVEGGLSESELLFWSSDVNQENQ